MPALIIELTDEQEARLREIAEARGIDAPECARALLGQLLGDPDIRSREDGAEPRARQPSNLPGGKPLWMRVVEAGMALPVEERARIPRDGSLNVDHYVYGLPKRE
jgi:hypothetical protein